MEKPEHEEPKPEEANLGKDKEMQCNDQEGLINAKKMRSDLTFQDQEREENSAFKWPMEKIGREKLISKLDRQNPIQIMNQMTDEYREQMEKCKGQFNQIPSLPQEDTAWMIDEIVLIGPDAEGDHLRFIKVVDKWDKCLGFNYADLSEVTFSDQSLHLVALSTLYPLSGKPRRPRFITFKDPNYVRLAAGFNTSQFKITYMYENVTQSLQTQGYQRFRECSLCGVRGTKDLFKKCSSCHATLYCSKLCQKNDWVGLEKMEHRSHKKWCKLMKEFMAQSEELKQLRFTYINETTSEDFDADKYKEFLERCGVYNQGLWRRECQLWRKPIDNLQFGDLINDDNAVILPVESTILNEDPKIDLQDQIITSWDAYYCMRGFRTDSPIAILLQYPLTLYYILTYCLPNDCKKWWDTIDTGTIRIDMVGVEKEVEMISLFQETGKLLPESVLDIHMFGKEMSRKLHGKEITVGNVTVTIHRKLHHRVEKRRKPHLVVGFNAGIGAYRSWSQTLVQLRTQQVPAYFTDYSRNCCEYSRRAIEGLSLGTISKPIINPFRSPVRKLADENDLPHYSNGFLFHIQYPE
ncbi:hypothetical protein CHS0354_033568 [Potamilus streckersoni]|uniref:MYND-type domain-containing protein n=1 Tax=Potamilus streckersoni TaxID=2493646 RepID=A0AAE0W5R3_9BIVA|nr:hypothetical protein CHS0354_033568 [Potamilus streckersoni]